ncbi:MAG: HNH endonuclease signature motif containing protein [Acidobacteriia bacterium]|nr:HNH endonuclease signature motif containing protein [Terriglobia bacterium]
MNNKLTSEYVRRLFDYFPESGLLQWKVTKGKGRPGKAVGRIRRDRYGGKYFVVTIDGKIYLAHRLIFLWMVGRWPKELIDHIDRNGLNNRWGNLREASKAQNGANAKLSKANKTGYKGVYFAKKHKKWSASIHVNHKSRNLGLFKSAIEASKAYQRAAVEAFGEFANG